MNDVRSLNLTANGLEMFLGPLEAACMRAIWADQRTTRKIWQHVRDNYKSTRTDESAYTSVTSTVYRLWEQEYLMRVGDKHAGFVYTPKWKTEAEFVNACLSRALTVLLTNYPREAGRIVIDYLRSANNAS